MCFILLFQSLINIVFSEHLFEFTGDKIYLIAKLQFN